MLTPDIRRSSRTQTRSHRPLEPAAIENFAIAVTRTTTRRRSPNRKVKKTTREKPAKEAVLVVDDVADVTEMLSLFLKHAGYTVATANSAEAALRMARRSNFKLVISDIGMPEMNGYQFAESLRTLSDYRATPIIAITGYTEYDDRGQSLRAGFNAHLTKPINPSQLLNLIEELLS